MDLIVTTAVKEKAALMDQAAGLCRQFDLTFVVRDGRSIDDLQAAYPTSMIVVVTSTGLVAHTPGGRFFFHPSMAELRIKNIENGNADHMVGAMQLQCGMSVLDCTLGLATDAIVASHIVGNSGQVTGLEASAAIALITGCGLQKYQSAYTAALRRISVRHTAALQYLTALPDNRFDIVYFDPMFEQPVEKSSNMAPLRVLADHQPLTGQVIEQAVRVAARRVVVKEGRGSGVFARLGIATVVGGKYSSVCYGIIDTGDGVCSSE